MIKKQDEIHLWNEVKNIPAYKVIEWEKLKIKSSRLHFILKKWVDLGIIEYDTSIKYAWLTGKKLENFH